MGRPIPRIPGTKDWPAANTRAGISSLGGNLSWESHQLWRTVSACWFRRIFPRQSLWAAWHSECSWLRYMGSSKTLYLVDTAQFSRALPSLLTEDIRIIDYGDLFRFGWPKNINQKVRMSHFRAPENRRGLRVARSSDLWALGCIIYKIHAGTFLFHTQSSLDGLLEIEDLLGSPYSNLLSPLFSEKSQVTEKLTQEQIFQYVAEMNVEPQANSEDAMIETSGLDYVQIWPYIKSDRNLFPKLPSSNVKAYVDMLIWSPAEIRAKRKMWKMEKLSEILSTEAEQLSNLLGSVLTYFPERRKTATSLAKHPWFVEPVRLEAFGNGKLQTGKPCWVLSQREAYGNFYKLRKAQERNMLENE